MFFKDIIGQKEAKRKLTEEVRANRIPHARLFCGKEGVGKLPLAIAYARYLACSHRSETDACGTCPNCKMYDKLAHPDLHFVFPVVKRRNKDTVSDDYLPQWREMLNSSPYFGLPQWLEAMSAENQQAQIFVKESDEMIRKLSLKSSQGGYKVMIIWLPEKMNQECSNKLLKLLEEPPTGTIFILVSEEPDALIATIRSRTQYFSIPSIDKESMVEVLVNRYGLQTEDAEKIARQSEGSLLKVLENIYLNEEGKQFFEWFVSLMRLAYQRKIREMKTWSEELASIGREKQKHFLAYAQRMVRENFVYNFHSSSINYLNDEEQLFATRFAPYINEKNVMEIMNELSEAERHIGQNVNSRMVFFDFALKMIVLLKK